MAFVQKVSCASLTVLNDKSRLVKQCVGITQSFSTSANKRDAKSYKLVIAGGGCGGTAAANMFAKKLGRGQVAIIEPKDVHYYQPLWTLVGGGICKFEESVRPQIDLLPQSVDWIKDSVGSFDPVKCTVTTKGGAQVKYEYLVVALGLQLNYHLIKGLPEGFDIDPQLCSNYWQKTVTHTRPALEAFKEGNAIFTFPNTPIKCAGAPQKIMYLAEEYFRKSGKREGANVIYNTSLGVIFGVKKYAEALTKIAQSRNIKINPKTNLVEVKADKKEAVFENLDTKERTTLPYSFMHVTPPMSTPDALKNSALVNEAGYVTVNKYTLQHTKFPNVFSIGDNTDIPTSKTAAAVASQTKSLKENLWDVMNGRTPAGQKYDGYTSCPLVTGVNKCVLAEFDWDGVPLETLPVNQAKELRVSYIMKRNIFPQMYWHMLVKGTWHGPSMVRKILHLGTGR